MDWDDSAFGKDEVPLPPHQAEAELKAKGIAPPCSRRPSVRPVALPRERCLDCCIYTETQEPCAARHHGLHATRGVAFHLGRDAVGARTRVTSQPEHLGAAGPVKTLPPQLRKED